MFSLRKKARKELVAMVIIAASEHTGLWAPVFSEQDWLKWAEQL